MSGLTWVNGRFVSPGEACLEAGERGFLFGDGLFETVRLYEGQAPVWPRHAERLAGACRALGIPYPEAEIAAGLEAVLAEIRSHVLPIPFGPDELSAFRSSASRPSAWPEECGELRRTNSGCGGVRMRYAESCMRSDDAECGMGAPPLEFTRDDAERAQSFNLTSGFGSLRLTVTRGAHPPGVRGLLPRRELRPTVVITANPGEPYPPDAYRSGQRAVTVSFPRNDLSPLVRLKSLNCLENVLGRREAAAGGADEGIFFNTRGDLAEGTASNVFLLFEDGRLVTPPAASGLLPGIAREIVLSVAKDLGLQAVVRAVSRRDIENAREVWLTNSLIEVMPLVSLDGVPVGEGRPGEIASRARQACREYMRRLRN